jgi:hypothetical protein
MLWYTVCPVINIGNIQRHPHVRHCFVDRFKCSFVVEVHKGVAQFHDTQMTMLGGSISINQNMESECILTGPESMAVYSKGDEYALVSSEVRKERPQ